MIKFLIYILVINWIALFFVARDRYNSLVAGPRTSPVIFLLLAVAGGSPSILVGHFALNRGRYRNSGGLVLLLIVMFIQLKLIMNYV